MHTPIFPVPAEIAWEVSKRKYFPSKLDYYSDYDEDDADGY